MCIIFNNIINCSTPPGAATLVVVMFGVKILPLFLRPLPSAAAEKPTLNFAKSHFANIVTEEIPSQDRTVFETNVQ